MKDPKSSRERLLDLLIRNVPGLVPVFGELWKAVYDELTDDDIERTLSRIEEAVQKGEATQVFILESVLSSAGEIRQVAEILNELQRRGRAQNSLRAVLELDKGNARFLHFVKGQPHYDWFQSWAQDDFGFYESYLDFLQALASGPGMEKPPFGLVMTSSLVAFPEERENYQHTIRNPPLPSTLHPVLLERFSTTKEEDTWFHDGGERKPLPDLPLKSGFIWGFDDHTGLPTAVREEPCLDYWGSFYWVKPKGLRIVVSGIGVTHALEAAYGTSLWWSPNESSPYFGFRPVREVEPDDVAATMARVRGTYAEWVKKYAALRILQDDREPTLKDLANDPYAWHRSRLHTRRSG